MPRRPDAALLRPCERPTAPIPAKIPYRWVLNAWQVAEAMLEQCAQSKDRLIEFERNQEPPNENKEKQS